MSPTLYVLLSIASWLCWRIIAPAIVVFAIALLLCFSQSWRKGPSIQQFVREDIIKEIRDGIMQMPLGQKVRIKQWFLERISQIDTGEAVTPVSAGSQALENGIEKTIHGIEGMHAQKDSSLEDLCSHSKEDEASAAQNAFLKGKREEENTTEPIHCSDEKELERPSNTTEARHYSPFCSTQILKEFPGVKQPNNKNMTALQHIDVNHPLEHKNTIQPPDDLRASPIPDHDKPLDIRTTLIRDTKIFMENLESRRRPSHSEPQYHIKNKTRLHHTSSLPTIPLETPESSNAPPHNDKITPDPVTHYHYTKSDLHRMRKASKAHKARDHPSNSFPISDDQKLQASSSSSPPDPDPTHEASIEDFLKRIDNEHGLGLTFQKAKGKKKVGEKEEKFDVQADFDNAKVYDWDSEVARKRRERIYPTTIVADETERKAGTGNGFEYGDGIEEMVEDMETEEDDAEWETLDMNKIPKEGLTWKEEMNWKLMSSWRKHNNMEPFW